MSRFKLLLIFLLPLLLMCSHSSDPENTVNERLEIGVILPLTGTGPIDGPAMNAALEFAVEDYNTYLAENGIDKEIEVILRDSEFNFLKTADIIEELTDSTKMILSATTSETILLTEQLISENDIVFVSATSTSPEFAKDDNIIRLIPDDNVTSKAIASKILSDGITNLAILYRSDSWGRNFAGAVRSEFEAGGGTVHTSRIYAARSAEYDAVENLPALNSEVETMLGTAIQENSALFVISFNEAIDILKAADEFPVLKSLVWYGSEGIGKNNELLADTLAAAVAAEVGLYSPMVGELDNSEYNSFKNRVETTIGHFYPHSAILYDAVFAAGQTLVATGTDPEITAIKNKFIEMVKQLTAVSGSISLNEAGDRISCSYDFWKVVKDGDSYSWINTH